MATVLEKPEVEEAVIISGPRKGSIVSLNGDEAALTAEEEAMLDIAINAMQSAAQTATHLSDTMHELNLEIVEFNRRRNGSS